MSKILVISDSHIVEQWLEELHHIFEEVCSYKADLLIISGDFLHRKHPTTKEIMFASKWGATFLKHFGKVIILRGNHDNVENVSNIDFLRYWGVDIVDDHEVKEGDYKAYFGHFFVDGSVDFEVEKKSLKKLRGYNRIILGHYHPTKIIKGSAKNPKVLHIGCYDEKTEILTNKGWKYFRELDKTEKIVTLNPKTQFIEYQNPTKYFSYRYKGLMYKIRKHTINLLVTPNHNIYCKRKGSLEYRLIKAEKIYKKNEKYIPKLANWEGKNIKSFILPKYEKKYKSGKKYSLNKLFLKKEINIPMNLWVQFLGWYLSEGYSDKNKVVICQKEGYKLKTIIDICKKISKHLNCKFSVLLNKNNSNIFSVNIHSTQLANYLKIFGKSNDKFVPDYIKYLPSNLINLFVESYIAGDGHISPTSMQITTFSKKMANDFQELAIKTNRHAKIVNLNRGYKIFFHERKQATIYPKNEKYVNYDGTVYCVEVPNHIIYIRRNGIANWCGNSCRFVNFDEAIQSHKTMIELDTETDGIKFIRLKSPIPMRNAHSLKELSTFSAKTKARLIINSQEKFKEWVNEIPKFEEKFIEFKYKLDYEPSQEEEGELQEIIEDNDTLKRCVDDFFKTIKDKEVYKVLSDEFHREGLK